MVLGVLPSITALVLFPEGKVSDDRPDLSRLAELAGGLGLHEHLCLVYETHEQQLRAALPYLRAGLERGERCLYIADENTATAVLDALRKRGTDVDRHLRSGALILANRQETYLKPGRFDPDWWIHFMSQATREASTGKFSGLRILLGEMTWVLEADLAPDILIQYEAKLNRFVLDHDVGVVCQYNLERFSPELILNVIRTHPLVVYGGIVCKNPYYVPPDEFLAPNQASREVERLLSNILAAERAERALRRSEETLRLVINTIPTMAWSVRPDGVVDFLNQRWTDYTGISLEQYVEAPTRPIHPEDIPRVLQKWRADMSAGEPSEDEMRLQRADGEYRWFLVRTAPLRDEKGNIVKWYGLSIDIEDRKRAEEELQRSEAELRTLSGRLLRLEDQERRRLARDLHDTTAQLLAALSMNLSVVNEFADLLNPRARAAMAEAVNLADQCLQEVRTISYLLHPRELDELGLESALYRYIDGFTQRSGIPVEVEVSPDLG
ncbi:MAG TPA: MEDS domain-containing protein, partial [Bryobacteraceae bacterium]|nr:MEDS domain-containing protein [Bryobacteraceae bacterium]